MLFNQRPEVPLKKRHTPLNQALYLIACASCLWLMMTAYQTFLTTLLLPPSTPFGLFSHVVAYKSPDYPSINSPICFFTEFQTSILLAMDDLWFKNLQDSNSVTAEQFDALRSCLQGSISPTTAAAHITAPIRQLASTETKEHPLTEELKEELLNLWGLLLDAVQEAPNDSVIQVLVSLVTSISHLAPIERAERPSIETFRESSDINAAVKESQFWSDLPLFWNYWSDFWNADQVARDGRNLSESNGVEVVKAVWTNMNAFAAHALASGSFTKGAKELLVGQLLTLMRDAAKVNSPLSAVDVPAAAVVMEVAGSELYRCLVEDPSYAQKVTKDEWNGLVANFRRIGTEQDSSHVDGTVRDAAARVVVACDKIIS